MKILEREIGLREETRAAEQARALFDREDYVAQARPLAETQRELKQRVGAVTEEIRELPNAEEAFRVEIAILTRVGEVMTEATLLLAIPQTGPGTIAAETEVDAEVWDELIYKDYFLASFTKSTKGAMVSYGLFNSVKVVDEEWIEKITE